MEYRVRDTGEIVSQAEFIARNPHMTPPVVWGVEWCDFCGIDPVFESPAPTVGELEIASRSGVEQDPKGNWVHAWVVVPMFADKLLDDGSTLTKQAQEEAYLAAKRDEKATAARAQRDRLLAETDWLVIRAAETGVAMTPEQSAYRQALRDITTQEGFPLTIEWPVLPA